MKMYDAIIIGARCAGSPTAMLLARKGLPVRAHHIVNIQDAPNSSARAHHIVNTCAKFQRRANCGLRCATVSGMA